jgi:pyruvate formate-lyase/glycerol dehydratase family glycyl radical enzyme
MEKVTLTDISLQDQELTQRVKNLRAVYFKAMPRVCIERPRLITSYSRKNGLFNVKRIGGLAKARLYRFVLEHRIPVVWHNHAYDKDMKPFGFTDQSLFAGSTTAHFKGVPLYPEFMALSLWPELRLLPKRPANPYYISKRDADKLNTSIFPHWIENNLTELARTRLFEENKKKYNLEKSAPELELLERLVFFLNSKANCISHTIPEFSRAVNEGLRCVVDDAARRKVTSAGVEQKEFFDSISEVCEGIIAYSRNIAEQAKKMARKQRDPALKAELEEIAAIHRRVPEFKARSFREGLTAVWMCWTAIHLENPNIGLSLGRLDQLLYHLYRQDIDSGILTVAQAIELVSCLWLKIGDHVPMVPQVGEKLFGGSGSNQAITIGGVDRQGNDAVNDLTYVMLRATELMRLRDPNLNARYYPGVNSDEYLKRLCEVNITTGATPALHNDKAVIAALTAKGDSLENARDYGVVGCVEPGSSGRSYGHSAAILLNLTSALELTLYNGRHRHCGMDLVISMETGACSGFGSFETFRDAFSKQAQWLIDQATALNDIYGKIHQDFYPTPILSSLFEGPMEKGKDLIFGGANINSSGAAIIGLADVADSLTAIEHLVFKKKAISFSELLGAIDADFVGHEPLLKRLQNPGQTPKYGNDDPEADKNTTWLIRLLDKQFGEKLTYRGGRYRVGYWSMTNHAGFGRLSQALPSGRRARENFSSGITPVSGATPCLAKALHSVAGQPTECLANGIALNIKYTPEAGRDKMLGNLAASVAGYFDSPDYSGPGGMEIQFNITSRERFLEEMADSASHPELLVRVSGYTAYFKDLNPHMQKEIVDRTEYLLSSGNAVPFEPLPLPEMKG